MDNLPPDDDDPPLEIVEGACAAEAALVLLHVAVRHDRNLLIAVLGMMIQRTLERDFKDAERDDSTCQFLDTLAEYMGVLKEPSDDAAP